jgi:ABC-type multidrug transport system fused ATPase/permease subunit
VNTFLNLPERDENLKGTRISTEMPIKRISFENVSFKYQGGQKAMSFDQTFVMGEVNYLTTPNGSGKTTKLYLLLGLLTPQKGKIIVEMKDNNDNYNLSKLDLIH